MAPRMTAPTKVLIERILADNKRPSLSVFVNAQRDLGRTWREIAEEVELETGVAISYESLRRWFSADTERAS